MEELLKGMTGKKIDVSCGGTAVYRGVALKVDGGVLYLQTEEETDVFISVERIAAVSECKDLPSRPGFVV